MRVGLAGRAEADSRPCSCALIVCADKGQQNGRRKIVRICGPWESWVLLAYLAQRAVLDCFDDMSNVDCSVLIDH